ncbi:MAG: hypothetical protein ACK5JU_10050 [Bacteroidales bacterium]
MKHFSKFINAGLFVLVAVSTSCLSPSETRITRTNTWGTVEPDPTNSNIYVRDDLDGALIYNDKFKNFTPGNRAMISYEAVAEEMKKTGGEEYYFPAYLSKFEEIPLQELKSYSEIGATDTFKFDPIEEFSVYQLLSTTYQGKVPFCMEVTYSGTAQTHNLDLVYNSDVPWVDGDTIRFELRHDKKGDTGSTRQFVNYLSYNFKEVFKDKTSIVVDIAYNVIEGTGTSKKHYNFKWEKQ